MKTKYDVSMSTYVRDHVCMHNVVISNPNYDITNHIIMNIQSIDDTTMNGITNTVDIKTITSINVIIVIIKCTEKSIE